MAFHDPNRSEAMCNFWDAHLKGNKLPEQGIRKSLLECSSFAFQSSKDMVLSTDQEVLEAFTRLSNKKVTCIVQEFKV